MFLSTSTCTRIPLVPLRTTFPTACSSNANFVVWSLVQQRAMASTRARFARSVPTTRRSRSGRPSSSFTSSPTSSALLRLGLFAGAFSVVAFGVAFVADEERRRRTQMAMQRLASSGSGRLWWWGNDGISSSTNVVIVRRGYSESDGIDVHHDGNSESRDVTTLVARHITRELTLLTEHQRTLATIVIMNVAVFAAWKFRTPSVRRWMMRHFLQRHNAGNAVGVTSLSTSPSSLASRLLSRSTPLSTSSPSSSSGSAPLNSTNPSLSSPTSAINQIPLRPYTLITSAFSHQHFWHLAFNMLTLVSCGAHVQYLLGAEQFLAAYVSLAVVSGWGSQAARVIVAKATSSPQLLTGASLGASGALMGLLGVWATLRPESQILLIFFPFQTVSIDAMLKILMTMDTLGILLRWRTFDHFAHLAGALAGIAYATWGIPNIWDQRDAILAWIRKHLGLPAPSPPVY